MAKMWYNRFRSGQAAVEYVSAILVFVALAGVLGYLVSAAYRSADRNENLVRSDYP